MPLLHSRVFRHSNIAKEAKSYLQIYSYDEQQAQAPYTPRINPSHFSMGETIKWTVSTAKVVFQEEETLWSKKQTYQVPYLFPHVSFSLILAHYATWYPIILGKGRFF